MAVKFSSDITNMLKFVVYVGCKKDIQITNKNIQLWGVTQGKKKLWVNLCTYFDVKYISFYIENYFVILYTHFI